MKRERESGKRKKEREKYLRCLYKVGMWRDGNKTCERGMRIGRRRMPGATRKDETQKKERRSKEKNQGKERENGIERQI